MEESFEIKIARRLSTEDLTESEDNGSEISDLDEPVEIDDEDHVETLNLLISSFGNIATVKTVGYREFKIVFNEQNAKLIDDEDANYQFEHDDDDIPVLNDPVYFVPFVNYLSNIEPSLIGVTIFTNLEGGGSLVI